MLAEWVRPEAMWVFRVAHGDVARHALCEAFAGEDAEGAGHVGEDPGAVFVIGAEEGDAGEGGALRDGLEGGEFFGRVGFGFWNDLGRGSGSGLEGDGRGCHFKCETSRIDLVVERCECLVFVDVVGG